MKQPRLIGFAVDCNVDNSVKCDSDSVPCYAGTHVAFNMEPHHMWVMMNHIQKEEELVGDVHDSWPMR